MGWREVQSLDELKQLGRLKEVAQSIAIELNIDKLPRNSWDKLWGFIESYKQREKMKDANKTKKEWQLVASEKELKKLGLSFKEIKQQVSEMVPNIEVKARSWEDLYSFIKQHCMDVVESKASYASPYFKDEASEIIFYLLELDGELRLKKLKVNGRYYKDKEQARAWHNELIKKIHPDQSHHEKAEEATKELNELYGSMIKFAK